MTDVPEKKAQEGKQPDSVSQVEAAPPEAVSHVPSNRVPVIAVSLAVLAVIGAIAASVPSFGRFARPVFKELFSSGDVTASSDFSRFSPPKPSRVAALPPVPVLVPDPVVRAGLRDIQSSEQQNADAMQKNTDALTALTQSAASQGADLKKITRQLALLAAQVNSLQNQPTQPATTSSLGGPLMTSGVPRPNPRTRIIHASRRVIAPAPPAVVPAVIPAAAAPQLPKAVGPVSVGGAPLSPAPTSGSDAS